MSTGSVSRVGGRFWLTPSSRPLIPPPPPPPPPASHAGPDGITSNAISAGLGLNLKRNETRMKELELRFGVLRHTITQVRTCTAFACSASSLWGLG